MISKRRLHNLVATYWQPVVFCSLLLAAFGVLYWLRLGTLTGGYSANELSAMQTSDSFRDILNNPVNAPYLLLARCLMFVHAHSLLFMRVTATLFGLVTLTTFYWLVRHWHGERSAILGTILFGCSAWFLHTTRLGSADVLLFLLLALVACCVWLQRTDNRFALVLAALFGVSLLYVPGMVWFIALGCIWQAKTLGKLLKEHSSMLLVAAAGAVGLLAPLAWAVYRSPDTLKVIAGLPAHGWPDAIESIKRLAEVPASLVFRTSLDATHWLARLPILDAFSIVMVALGAYLYARHHRLTRSRLMGVVLVVGAVLIALGGAVNLSILMPFVYVLAAAGMGFMLDRWYQVFPRNAIAQGVGVGIVVLAVAASCWYGLRHYFVAWPNAPATKQVFVIK